MKRKLFLMACCIALYVGACMAQDVIVTRDARKIECWVFEVSMDEVKYKRFDNPDGPTYTLEKCLIASIAYQNGKVETFEKCRDLEPEPEPEPAPEPAEPAPEPAPKSKSKPAPAPKPKPDATGAGGGFFVMPGISAGSALSFSLMAGYAGNWGAYLKAKSSFAPKADNPYRYDIFFDAGYAKTGRTAFGAGIIKRITPAVYLYGGAGYGTWKLLWKDLSSTLYEVDSHSGVEPEIGAIIQIRRFFLSGGVSALLIDPASVEACIAVGFKF